MFRTIRWRLVLSYVLLTVLTVSVVGALATSLVRRQVKRQEAAHLQANAEAVARQAQDLIWPVARESELQELAQTAAFLSGARVRILDRQRRTLADSGSRAEGEAVMWIVPSARWRVGVSERDAQPVLVVVPTDRQHMMSMHLEDPFDVLESLAAEAPYTVVRRWEEMGGSRFRFHSFPDLEHMGELVEEEAAPPRSEQVMTVPIDAEAGRLGYVEISGGPDLSAPALQTTGRAFGLAAGGATLLAVGVGLAVSQGLSSPIRRLTAAADRMSGGDLSARASVRGRDEIGQLAGQFNEMAGRLEASFAELAAERDALRRFIADASHELRTPITALKNFNDLLLGAAADDPAARAEFLAESQVQIERLEWITRNLLDLSRLDAGLAALDRAEHDVGELIEGAVSAFRSVARERGIDLTARLPEPRVNVCCDRARIELALSNLIENALKFTPAGGRVEVGGRRGEGSVRLWVRDTGIGIDAEDRPHIFERFYRGRNAPGEGSGLGLAIVHSVVQAHGGRVWAESRPGAGSTFTIELPEG